MQMITKIPYEALQSKGDNQEIIELLEADGWYLYTTRGDHRQFKHPEKTGKVTVRGKPSETLDQFLLNSIWKQAGWR